jgi:hypothetical protein
MSEFFEDSRLSVEEHMQSGAFPAQADDDTPALKVACDSFAGKESYDALKGQSAGRLADPTVTDVEAKGEAPGSAETLSGNTAGVNKFCTPHSPIPPQTLPDSETSDLFNEIKQLVAHCTLLPDDDSALVAFWVISTWFQAVLQVFPGLAISGSGPEAISLLNVLHDLCDAPIRLAGLRRGDLKDLGGFTLLISEPNLDNRMAALLGNLTNRNFLLVEERSFLRAASSKAVYLGEDSAIKRIQNWIPIQVHATVALDYGAVANRSRRQEIDGIKKRMLAYRIKNLSKIRSLEFTPHGLSGEANVIANALGSCIVESPQLQKQLVALLKPQARQHFADRSSGDEALILGAALALCHQDKGQIFVREITAEVNRLLAARGETRQLSPEKVGHKLKKIGLYTRRLSQAGNGLILDQATRKRLREIAAAYLGEVLSQENENLHCSLGEKSEVLMEDVEDMKDLPL